MASKTGLWHIVLTVVLCLLVIATFIPQPAAASGLNKTQTLPDLDTFIQSVRNGDADTLRGVYTNGLFAFPVVQQPSHDPAFVSIIPNTLTQFGLALAYGNTGLLAHDFLAGAYFSLLSIGQDVQLVYGDGRTEHFTVTKIYRYQATDPNSVYSKFIDLDTQQTLSSTELFKKVYMGPTHVTFQTCIEANGEPSWGRLFVIAEP
jgi:hypothetical protein